MPEELLLQVAKAATYYAALIVLMRVAGKRMSAAQCFGKGNPRVEAEACEAHRHVVEKSTGAAEEMRHARYVKPQTIIAVDIERGAVAAGPAGKRKQAYGILLRRCRRGGKLRANGAGVG